MIVVKILVTTLIQYNIGVFYIILDEKLRKLDLLKAIISYSKYNGSHNKDEHYLKELLKDDYLL